MCIEIPEIPLYTVYLQQVSFVPEFFSPSSPGFHYRRLDGAPCASRRIWFKGCYSFLKDGNNIF